MDPKERQEETTGGREVVENQDSLKKERRGERPHEEEDEPDPEYFDIGKGGDEEVAALIGIGIPDIESSDWITSTEVGATGDVSVEDPATQEPCADTHNPRVSLGSLPGAFPEYSTSREKPIGKGDEELIATQKHCAPEPLLSESDSNPRGSGDTHNSRVAHSSLPGVGAFACSPSSPLIDDSPSESEDSSGKGDEESVLPSVPSVGIGIPEEEEEEATKALPVANEISDTNQWPTAEEYDHQDHGPQTNPRRQFLIKAALCQCLCLLVIIPLGIGIGMHLSVHHQAPAPHNNISSVQEEEEEQPLLPQDILQDLLPEYTLLTIHNDPHSAQALAYHWAIDDIIFFGNISHTRIRKRYALVTFYYAMGGKNWVTKDGWLDHNLHECQWHATKQFPPYVDASDQDPNPCEHYWPMTANTSSSAALEDQEVAREYEYHNLRLKSMDLMGTIPPQINLLSSLRSIDLAHNKVTGNLATEIGLLSQLTSLVLPGNSISGALPSEMGLLRDLEIHDLHLNLLSGSLPSEVTQMTKLSMLSVMHNKVSGTIPTSIGRLSFLKLLDVSRNQGIGGIIPTQIGLLKDLVYLDLSHLPLLSGRIPSEIGPLATAGSLFKANFNGTKHLSGTVPDGLCFLTTTACVRTGPFPAFPKAQCQLDHSCSDLLCGCNCPCGR